MTIKKLNSKKEILSIYDHFPKRTKEKKWLKEIRSHNKLFRIK